MTWEAGRPVSVMSLLRPRQWLKNLILFFPPFLGGTLLLPGVWQMGLLPIISYSLASSSGYILNDLLDRECDRRHPTKRKRPLASGVISPPSAIGVMIFVTLLSLVTARFVGNTFLLLVLAYLAVTLSYSIWLKDIPVVDLFCIAAGFLLRLQAGGEVFSITISPWLFLSVFLLSLFLSAGKRRAEKGVTGDGGHRKVLSHYPDGFLEGVLFMTGAAALVTYSMYTLSHQKLIYTVPLCCFGLLRYLLRVQTGGVGDPTDALLKDPWLSLLGVLWIFLVGWGVYG
ncbi:MAG: decaprenyl-phosphate phosphoribosyltransferase [Desulfuromonadia bacterium]